MFSHSFYLLHGLLRPSHIASTAAAYTFMPKAIRTSLLPFWPESGHKTSIYHSIIRCSTPKIRGTCYKNTDGVLLIILVVDECMLMITWKGWSKRTILKCLQSFQLKHGSTGRELSFILPHFFHHPLPSFLTLGAAQACVCSPHTYACSYELPLLASKGVGTAYQNAMEQNLTGCLTGL